METTELARQILEEAIQKIKDLNITVQITDYNTMTVMELTNEDLEFLYTV